MCKNGDYLVFYSSLLPRHLLACSCVVCSWFFFFYFRYVRFLVVFFSLVFFTFYLFVSPSVLFERLYRSRQPLAVVVCIIFCVKLVRVLPSFTTTEHNGGREAHGCVCVNVWQRELHLKMLVFFLISRNWRYFYTHTIWFVRQNLFVCYISLQDVHANHLIAQLYLPTKIFSKKNLSKKLWSFCSQFSVRHDGVRSGFLMMEIV